MSVKVKYGKWKYPNNIIGDEDIELIPPTSEEIKNLKVGDRVLVEMVIEETGYMSGVQYLHYTTVSSHIGSVRAILPSPEPQRGLPEILEKLKETPSPFCYTDILTPKINEIIDCQKEIIDYLKAQKGEK